MTLGISLGNRRLRSALYHGLRERVEGKNWPQINADTRGLDKRDGAARCSYRRVTTNLQGGPSSLRNGFADLTVMV